VDKGRPFLNQVFQLDISNVEEVRTLFSRFFPTVEPGEDFDDFRRCCAMTQSYLHGAFHYGGVPPGVALWYISLRQHAKWRDRTLLLEPSETADGPGTVPLRRLSELTESPHYDPVETRFRHELDALTHGIEEGTFELAQCESCSAVFVFCRLLKKSQRCCSARCLNRLRTKRRAKSPGV
jgi:hypothetical protein